MTELGAAPQIKRDRFLRPLVIPRNGGSPKPYTRCTTFVGAIEDTYNLDKWKQRQVALGLVLRPDLQLAVAAHREDKSHLDRLCSEAMEAAASSRGATTGTALHALTEQVDRGETPFVPQGFIADLAAYQSVTEPLKAVHIEAFCVLDTLEIGGTPDRVVKYQDQRYIADVKTGDITWGALKIAAQLAVYARSSLYDIATGERTTHGADLERGIIIHLPAGSGTCTLYWVDLVAGWEAVKVADLVRQQRALKYPQLVKPVASTQVRHVKATPKAATPLPTQPPELALPGVSNLPKTLAERIAECTSYEQTTQLYHSHKHAWTDDLTALAKQHVATLAASQEGATI